MNIEIHIVNGARIAEVISGETVISSLEDAVDLIGNLYYQEADKIILHEKAITPAFFDLKNKIVSSQEYSVSPSLVFFAPGFFKKCSRSSTMLVFFALPGTKTAAA